MKAFKIPAPGTHYGPCTGICTHLDCIANRQDAAESCPICHKGIGYENWIYRVDGQLVHQDCQDKEWDEKGE